VGLRPDEADDVIQETFLRLFRDFTSEMALENARPWAFRVAQHLAVDEHRKAERLISMDGDMRCVIEIRRDPSLNPEESLAQKEQFERLLAAASKLTAQQWQCLHLRAEGLRYREIAAALGVSIPRVSVVIEKALARLAGEL
jgi:RNA polymerase sigma-70 factor (ECF subfamily)